MVIVSFIIIITAYSWLVLPRPFYDLRLPDPAVPCIAISPIESSSRFTRWFRVLFLVLTSVRLEKPAFSLAKEQAARFVSIFPEPTRPLVNRKELGDYYIGIPKYFESLATADKTLFVFRSRAALLGFPVRFILDHLLSAPLTYFALVVYLMGLGIFWLRSRYSAWKCQELLSTVYAEKSAYFRQRLGYLNTKHPPWEPGFLLFKLLEGYQFHKCISQLGHYHPCCEFGIEDAVTSSNHLKDVDYIDVGCEAIKETPILGEMRYGELVNCYIESNPFPDGAFRQVYLVHVVDHIPDLAKVLNELNRICEMGGRIFFSGFSNRLSGTYFEHVVYQGNIYNNEDANWYRERAKEAGFETEYQSHMQAGWAFRLWRFTVFFHHRTQVWVRFSEFYGKSAFIRNLYGRFIHQLLLPLFLMDEQAVEKDAAGLNFMIVVRKVSAI